MLTIRMLMSLRWIIYRIQTFEKYLADPNASQDHYAHYKAGLIPDIFYGHNMPEVMCLFRKQFLK